MLTCIVWCGAALRAADDVPQWVRQAAAVAVPTYPAKVSSVVLFQEEAVTVDVDGRRVMRERGAVRILAGSEKLEAYRTYNTRSGRIRDFQGWMIPPTGKSLTYPKNRVIDVAISENWEEERAKLLEAGSNVPGSVFAWEVTEEEKTIFTQYPYRFQGRAPVLVSRLNLTLPAGWEVRGTFLNHANLEPQVSGSTYTWELRDLPWIEKEEYSPALASLVPHLMVSYFPSADNRAGLQGLKDWASVSTWLSRMAEPPAEATAAIQAKAAQLTANAGGELEKMRAIARFTQSITYVSIDMNVTRGGGYTPHRAEDTLTHNYGDCKDKATLMRALLKASGIESYPLVIYSSDRTFVRPEWASPMQFNHAIVAIRVSGAISLPTVLPETPFGPLLIFDPTDPITQVGDLPWDEQGSRALLVAPEHGTLLTMPKLPASANRVESSVEAVMDAAGHIDATVRREYHGQSGVGLREIEKLDGNAQLKKAFERGLSRRLTGLALKRVETVVTPDDNLAVTLSLSSDRFGQIMQGRLFVVRPGLLNSGGDYGFPANQRSAPIQLRPDLRHDTIRIKLPPGFKLDELPGAATIESPYGRLEANWVVHEDEIVMEQTLEIRDTVAPASAYRQVREFFDKLSGAESAPVILLKEPAAH
jgi:transglutaminase-like putative cysteine protease